MKSLHFLVLIVCVVAFAARAESLADWQPSLDTGKKQVTLRTSLNRLAASWVPKAVKQYGVDAELRSTSVVQGQLSLLVYIPQSRTKLELPVSFEALRVKLTQKCLVVRVGGITVDELAIPATVDESIAWNQFILLAAIVDDSGTEGPVLRLTASTAEVIAKVEKVEGIDSVSLIDETTDIVVCAEIQDTIARLKPTKSLVDNDALLYLTTLALDVGADVGKILDVCTYHVRDTSNQLVALRVNPAMFASLSQIASERVRLVESGTSHWVLYSSTPGLATKRTPRGQVALRTLARSVSTNPNWALIEVTPARRATLLARLNKAGESGAYLSAMKSIVWWGEEVRAGQNTSLNLHFGFQMTNSIDDAAKGIPKWVPFNKKSVTTVDSTIWIETTSVSPSDFAKFMGQF